MRRELKVAIVAAGLKYQQIADKARRSLGSGKRLTEHDITRLVTGRKRPTPRQALALAEMLNRPPAELFPEVGE
jgi:hypothetical protein